MDKEQTFKTLGLLWNSEFDQFLFSLNFCNSDKFTKRNTLSTIAKIFDPLGLLAPIMILLKIFIQKLWQIKLDWDATLPEVVQIEWLNIISHLDLIRQIKVPCFVLINDVEKVEMLGFSDASVKAYGAAVYLRSTNSAGITSCKLVASKTRVAPLKTISLPKP